MFADALDPEYNHLQVPKPGSNGGIDRESLSNSTAKNYLSNLRAAHQRWLDLLGADVDTINMFIRELVTPLMSVAPSSLGRLDLGGRFPLRSLP